jgi:predicted RNA-binding protein
MCLSKAYLSDKKDEEPVLEDISSLEVRDGEIVLSTILGEEQVIKGQIEKVNFTKNTILIEKR